MLRIRVLSGLTAILLLGGIGASTAQAQDRGHKLRRGLINATTGWIELPKSVRRGAGEENPLLGLGVGLVRGIASGALRTGVGLYEVVTFPVAYPADFAPVYEPETVFD